MIKGFNRFDFYLLHCHITTSSKLFMHMAHLASSIMWYWPKAGHVTMHCRLDDIFVYRLCVFVV